jgi:hypothetical protein
MNMNNIELLKENTFAICSDGKFRSLNMGEDDARGFGESPCYTFQSIEKMEGNLSTHHKLTLALEATMVVFVIPNVMYIGGSPTLNDTVSVYTEEGNLFMPFRAVIKKHN